MSTQQEWLVKPHQTQPQLLEWARRYPHLVEMDSVQQFCGHEVYVITVTDRSVPDKDKRKCLFTQPHAHEPATTAACMNFLSQVLDGHHLDGSPTDLDRERILKETVLSFMPDGNPDGRSRSPELWWDGSKWSNDEFWCFMHGIDPRTLKMWERFDHWDLREQDPRPLSIGIVYEQIGEFEYVEPNRSHASAYFRLIHHMLDKYDYDQFLDLHQTEFVNSEHNCMMLLPILQNELPEDVQRENALWAQKIIAAWQQAGASPIPNAEPLNYTGVQGDYFRNRWGHIYRRMPCISTEVHNNHPRTPPIEQRRLTEIAIRVSVERLLRRQ